MSKQSNASLPTDTPGSDAPVDSGLIDSGAVFVLVSVLSTLTCALCIITIILSSRHLYSKKFYSKMPLFASLLWFESSLFLGISVYYTGTLMHDVAAVLSWIGDIGARSMILWFTYIRTATLWPGAYLIKVLVVTIQTVQLVAFGLAVFVTWPTGPVEINSRLFNAVVSVYASSDTLTALLDALLIFQLWRLKAQLACQSSSAPPAKIKPLFFYFATAAIVASIGLSLAMAALSVSGNDPYWGFNTILFAFRILLNDVFSNLIRDSLIEKSHSQMSSEASSPQPSRDGRSALALPSPVSSDKMHNSSGVASDGDERRWSSTVTIRPHQAPPPTLILAPSKTDIC